MESTGSQPNKRILFVDDEEIHRYLNAQLIECMGYAVETVASAQEALQRLEKESFELVITDNYMPAMSGADMATAIKQRFPAQKVFMYSGHIPKDRSSLDAVLTRPGSVRDLNDTISKLMGA